MFVTAVRQRAAADRLGPRASASTRGSSARRSSPHELRDRVDAAGRAPHRRAADLRRPRGDRPRPAPTADAPAAGPTSSPTPATAEHARRRDPPRAVRAAGDAREHPDRRRPRRPARSTRRSCAATSRSPSRSCARTSRCSTSSTSAPGTYVLYAEIGDDGTIEVEPEPYGDSFARPARLLPVEAKALIAAIDLIGEHIPEGSLASVREKVVAALGEDPVARRPSDRRAPAATTPRSPAVVSRAIAARRLLSFEYYKENEDEFTTRLVEPYALINGREGWYVASFDPVARRRPPLPPRPLQVGQRDRRVVRAAARRRPCCRRRRLAADRRGARLAPRPRLDLARAGALGARGAHRDRGARGRLRDRRASASPACDYLVREVLKEAGDAVVLEPADARDAVRDAAEAIRAADPVAASC